MDSFIKRHIGSSEEEIQQMLDFLQLKSLDELIDKVIPPSYRTHTELRLPSETSEEQALKELKNIGNQNSSFRYFIGMGYSETTCPMVIRRMILENPEWYTPYTPYQSEISQGRLEALLNFQTVVCELTGLPIANASLLDEASACVEAMLMCKRLASNKNRNKFFLSKDCHPQILSVITTRSSPLEIELVIDDWRKTHIDESFFGALVSYPDTAGSIFDYSSFCEELHKKDLVVVVNTDLLALTLFKSPGEFGADIAVGSAQRFGLPLFCGGPHPAFISAKKGMERKMPGRIVGISKDVYGNPALRLALQTREQHIRREKATSNICTAQVLPAIVASMYAAYYGAEGLKEIAQKILSYSYFLYKRFLLSGFSPYPFPFFDTLKIPLEEQSIQEIKKKAIAQGYLFREFKDSPALGITLGEKTTIEDLRCILNIFGISKQDEPLPSTDISLPDIPIALQRQTEFLNYKVFKNYRTETKLNRYIKKLSSKDINLTTSMIPLGSCTMKLNPASAMIPILWDCFTEPHPFAGEQFNKGYLELASNLKQWLAEITAMDCVSLQPNAGSQGELAGLIAIRNYFQSMGQDQRTICLIPTSAHGTNCASAALAGLNIEEINCDSQGRLNLDELEQKAKKYASKLAVMMITFPSTYGVFEKTLIEASQIMHSYGGQVYLDGANANAFLGLCKPGELGVDVCHLNLHKTFCIPHGGGGPGVGPIAVKKHLEPFLPSTHLELPVKGKTGLLCSAPMGNAGVLPVSWMYIRMAGAKGLKLCAQLAILNANYIAKKLAGAFTILYKGDLGYVAHEFIIDLRPWQEYGIEVEDVAKRLMDYGFHAPTISWPVHGTMMIEPTESESKEELDRFCEALLLIRKELEDIKNGVYPQNNNPIKNAPHPHSLVCSDHWPFPYSRQLAAYPAPWQKEFKYWPPTGRIDNVYGDRNFVCCIEKRLAL
ncbi:aminomethyl-transferring glycine dehydrogenase [Methylacidiphilum caldifontis]|uniref:aminomethyl-transferring glycine dehydrogenase n=1 Tax=Methylacidiphilum caldifontis TaxID=2795386 RepID=UPI001A8C8845|nr:aminomethyl-transferring glycine dehydrogenase [Methylacidiphilum caldifontis]QSR87839.1 aminomethyl-transferring glycine dehydrogenase [Methylacidiphilum caldifontis]